MTLHQLKIFAAVAEHRNITRASRRIQISQPSVSKQLRLLEKECGTKFYVKSGRGVKVTEEGRLLEIAAKPILAQMEDLKRIFVTKVSDAKAKNFLVGSTPSPAAYLLPGVLKSFVKLHPAVHPTLRTGYPEAIEEMVLDGEVEMALTTTPPQHPQILGEAIHSEKLVAVVSAKHPLAKKQKLSSAELTQVPFVMTTRGRIAGEIEKLGLKLNVAVWCESIDLKKAAVQAGLGVGLFYYGSAEAGLRQGYFKSLQIPRLNNIKIPCFAIYRKGSALSTNLRDLLVLLRRETKNIDTTPVKRVQLLNR